MDCDAPAVKDEQGVYRMTLRIWAKIEAHKIHVAICSPRSKWSCMGEGEIERAMEIYRKYDDCRVG